MKGRIRRKIDPTRHERRDSSSESPSSDDEAILCSKKSKPLMRKKQHNLLSKEDIDPRLGLENEKGCPLAQNQCLSEESSDGEASSTASFSSTAFDEDPTAETGASSSISAPLAQTLDFPLGKLLFLSEKMCEQPPSADLCLHASRIVQANREKIICSDQASVAKIFQVFARKDLMEEAMAIPPALEALRGAVLTLSDAPGFVMPISFYHRLLEEVDLGTHHDYPGLKTFLLDFALLPPSPVFCEPGGERLEPKTPERRIVTETLTFALLELWPGSMALGGALFKSIFKRNGSEKFDDGNHAVRRQNIFAVVNLTFRVLAGHAQGCEVDPKLATRLVGNLLNLGEAATRQSLAQEVSHLVAYYSSMAKVTASGGCSGGTLPGQIGPFLKHLSQLTYEKQDRRLDMVALLTKVLRDHLVAHQSSLKLAAPAVHMVVELLPFDVAVRVTCETMLESSNSHVRAAVLRALIDVLVKDSTVLLGPMGEKGQADLWELLVTFLGEDPVEKVRLAVLDAVEALSPLVAHLDSANSGDQGDSSASPSAGISTLVNCPAEALVALVLKCGDVSLKVQRRAAGMLGQQGEEISGELKESHLKDVSCSVSMEPLLEALELLGPRAREEIAEIVLGMNHSMERDPELFCEEARLQIKQLARLVGLNYVPQVSKPKKCHPGAPIKSSRPLKLSQQSEPLPDSKNNDVYTAIMFD